MANKVTGRTDTSGALTTAPVALKSIIVVATAGEDKTAEHAAGEIFSITGTNDAVAAFGANSLVPKMVRVLISNGVDNIKGIVVADGENGFVEALDATMADKTIKVILCDNNNAATITAVKDHLILAESNDRFRYSVFAPTVEDTADQTKLTAFAKTVNSNRIFIPGPALLGSDGKAVELQVVAAGLAGAIMTETDDPALPMNGVQIMGFSGVSRTMLETEMKALANAGVTALYPEGSVPAVYRLVTSAIDDQVWQEGSTRFIADYVLESNEELLRANYKRTKNVTRILNAIRDDIKINMEKMEAAEIIENWDESTLTVTKDPQDAYGALVDYEFDVVTPLYTITINQHMKL